MIAKILASVGLPNTAAGKKKFYELFKDENSYHMAMGGMPNYAFAGTTIPGDTGNTGSNPKFVKPANAKKVDIVKPGFKLIAGQDKDATETYFDKAVAVAKPSVKKGNEKELIEHWIKEVQNGANPDDIAGDGKHLDKSFLPLLQKNYKAVYTKKDAPVKQGIPLKDSDRIDRKDVSKQTGSGLEPWQTWAFPDVNSGYSGATNKTVDPATGRYIDVTKSELGKDPKDPTRSILVKPYYTHKEDDPEGYLEPGTLKQTRLNTAVGSSTDNAVTNAYSGGLAFGGVPNFFNPQYFMNKGGMPCFNCGGMKEDGGAFVDDGTVPMMNFGGMDGYMQAGGSHKMPNGTTMLNSDMQGTPNLSKSDYVNMFKSLSKKPSKSSTTQGETDEAFLDKRNSSFKESIQNYFMEHMNKELAEEAYNADQQMMNSQYAQYGQTTNQFGRMSNPASDMFKAQYQGMEKQANENYGNFMGATNQMFDNADPTVTSTIKPYTPKAAEGIQVSLNPTTGKPWSAQEWAEIQKLSEGAKKSTSTPDKTGDKWYNQGYGSHGMDYFPMNYNPYMKMSKEDKANWEMLEANPTTNLKEFRTRHFGPWGSTKMVFGAKDKLQPFTPTGQVPLGGGNEYVPTRNTPTNPLDAGIKQTQVEKMMNPFNKDAQRQLEIMKGLGRTYPENKPQEEVYSFEKEAMKKAFGGSHYLPKHQVPPGQIGGDSMWNFQGANYNTTPTNPYTPPANNITMQGKTQAEIDREKAGLPPESLAGDPLTNYSGDEKQYEITQKYRPGFQGEDVANWTIAGMAGATSFLNSREVAKNKEKYLNEMSLADNQHYSQRGSRGSDQDQWGNRSPDQHVPVKYAGFNTGDIQSGTYGAKFGGGIGKYLEMGGFAEGGEYYLSDDEIEQIMNLGGNIQIIED